MVWHHFLSWFGLPQTDMLEMLQPLVAPPPRSCFMVFVFGGVGSVVWEPPVLIT